MTELQKERAVALAKIRRANVSHENEFVRHMNCIVNNRRYLWLSAAQGDYLAKICWKYREQLKTEGFGQLVPAQSPFDADNHYTTENQPTKEKET